MSMQYIPIKTAKGESTQNISTQVLGREAEAAVIDKVTILSAKERKKKKNTEGKQKKQSECSQVAPDNHSSPPRCHNNARCKMAHLIKNLTDLLLQLFKPLYNQAMFGVQGDSFPLNYNHFSLI